MNFIMNSGTFEKKRSLRNRLYKPFLRPQRLVRVTGLEPVRQRHTPLKRACLPIPAHSHILFLSSADSTRVIISQSGVVVNCF